jgi:hypothetical protein
MRDEINAFNIIMIIQVCLIMLEFESAIPIFRKEGRQHEQSEPSSLAEPVRLREGNPKNVRHIEITNLHG